MPSSGRPDKFLKSEGRPGPVWTISAQRRPDKNPIFGIRPVLLLPGVLHHHPMVSCIAWRAIRPNESLYLDLDIILGNSWCCMPAKTINLRVPIYVVQQVSNQGGVGIKKRHLGSNFFFSAARGRPTYYIIRHKSIYGNNDIIAVDIFGMISLPGVVYLGFGFPPYHTWLLFHNRGILHSLWIYLNPLYI